MKKFAASLMGLLMMTAGIIALLTMPPVHAAVVSVYGAVPPTYIGLSTDTKPINTVKKGALFIETDTSRNYRWTGSESIGTSSDWTRSNLAVSLDTTLQFEDTTNSVAKVEQQFSYKIATADTQVKAAAGFVHAVTCATTAGAAATAGALTLRDALTETTPIAYTIGIPATAFVPFTVVLNATFATGIYAGFDGTLAGVSCTVSYR